jgi:hypothetical protein
MEGTELKKELSLINKHWRFREKLPRKRQIIRAWDMECSGILKKLAATMTPEAKEVLLNSSMCVGVTEPPESTLEKTYNYCSEEAQQRAEVLTPRPDGKQICNYLRQMRQELAKANNIPFTCQECTVSEPCAGTCALCDAEAAYLNEQMQQKAPEKRVYPRYILQKWEGLA